ncbi:MAG TPA: cytochrome c [Terriglobales bacterium]|jgi:mono/diheme cytochrome c family protein
MVNRISLVLTIFLLPALFLFAAQDTPDSAAGAAAYKTKCLTCHGADGSGNTPVGKSLKVADLRSDPVQKKSDDELAQSIAEGKGNMPSFKNSTSADQIKALVAHIRSLAAKKKAD